MHVVKTRRGWSKAELASEFEVDVRTITKLVDGIEPRGGSTTAKNKSYLIADVAFVLGNYKRTGNAATASMDDDDIIGLEEGQIHPNRLDPKSRKEWYDGEKVCRQMLVDAGELVPRDEVRDGMSEVFKTIKAFLLTLADVLERDAGLPAAGVARVVKLCDKLCDKLSDTLLEGD